MAGTLFSTVSRLSPAHISNQFITAAKDVYLGGLVKGEKQGIKVYDDLDGVESDFEPYSSFWKKARAYFTANSEAASLLAITFAPGDASQLTAPVNVKATPTDDGATVTAEAGASTESAITADAAGAVAALKKYYFAGPQFWFLAEFDEGVSEAISNFVELQNTGIYLAFNTDATKLQGYTANKRTYKLTSPAFDDTTADVQDQYNHVLDASFAGAEYGRKPHAAVKYALGNLPYVMPQDRYEFTPDTQEELDQYNIATYAYVFTNPKMTSSRMSADDIHIDQMLGWDWIQNKATANIVNLYSQNADQGIPWNEVGFDSIINTIKGAFIDAGDLDIIAPLLDDNGNETGKPDYEVTYLKPSELPKSYETKREMRGVKTKYHPMGMVEDVYIENTIIL